MKYANFAFALTAAAFGFFILGYTIGVDDGAEQQIDSIRKALAEPTPLHVVDSRTTPGGSQFALLSDGTVELLMPWQIGEHAPKVTATCAAVHADGKSCVDTVTEWKPND